MKTSKTLIAAAAWALSGLAQPTLAGGQQVTAAVAADGQSIVVRTYRCGTPSSLSLRGTAEGIVSGQRRTIELEITAGAQPGVFGVARQWPAEGRWALVFSVKGGHDVSTLVTLEAGAALRIAEQKASYERPSPERIDAALTSARAALTAR
jgi:hypothetical protein